MLFFDIGENTWMQGCKRNRWLLKQNTFRIQKIIKVVSGRKGSSKNITLKNRNPIETSWMKFHNTSPSLIFCCTVTWWHHLGWKSFAHILEFPSKWRSGKNLRWEEGESVNHLTYLQAKYLSVWKNQVMFQGLPSVPDYITEGGTKTLSFKTLHGDR